VAYYNEGRLKKQYFVVIYYRDFLVGGLVRAKALMVELLAEAILF